jgi:hypothetical protein
LIIYVPGTEGVKTRLPRTPPASFTGVVVAWVIVATEVEVLTAPAAVVVAAAAKDDPVRAPASAVADHEGAVVVAPAGYDCNDAVRINVSLATSVPPNVNVTGIDVAVPATGTAGVVVPTETVPVPAANAGTTDKSPNPSEATATADTFFNEIVFTIFLSFSRFQAFPGLGGWLKRPPH